MRRIVLESKHFKTLKIYFGHKVYGLKPAMFSSM
jgi:hypothetical protein